MATAGPLSAWQAYLATWFPFSRQVNSGVRPGGNRLFPTKRSLSRFDSAHPTREVIARVNPRFATFKDAVLRLSGGQRQSIAIARALHFNAKILIMDEPTAALGHKEAAMFKELVLRLKSEGIGMIMVSHDLHDVFEISDRVTVMTNGRQIGTRRTEEVTKDQVLGMIILGKQPEEETADDIAHLH